MPPFPAHPEPALRVGRTTIPIAALLAAARDAAEAVRTSAADNRDADSPGGSKVTPGEVAEDVAAFVAAFGLRLAAEVLG